MLPDLKNCRQLAILNVSGNQLDTIDCSLGQLVHLRVLNVDRNSITYLPVDLCKCHQLEELSASTNKIVCPPPEVMEQNVPCIRRFLVSRCLHY